MLDTDRSFINATSGADILDKTPREAMQIFEGLANASQQYGKHQGVRGVHKLDSSRDGHKDDHDRLTKIVNKMAMKMNQSHQARPCDV